MENSEEQRIHIFSEGQSFKLYEGSMLDMFDVIEPNSIDAIVTDPPYELGFMSKSWDSSGIAFQKETWEKCLKVLKPGGYLLAFGGSRTFHRIACAIEDAGFEIRDTIMYLYGTGFPKSMDISKSLDKHFGFQGEKIGERKFGKTSTGQSAGWHNNNVAKTGKQDIFAPATDLAKRWQGFGTALKPAYEPVIVARKPCEGSCIDNVLKYGVGGINIDECRVPMDQSDIDMINAKSSKNPTDNYNQNESKKYGDYALNIATPANEQGRFPSNVILTYDETDFDEVCGGMPDSKGCSTQHVYTDSPKYGGNSLLSSSTPRFNFQLGYNDNGSAARYFYCAKASKRDRDEGLPEGKHNIHPTVKNTMLMQYLIRLVTPKGGTILDPFNGSGSTGKAAMYENKDRNAGYKYIGIELTPEYLPISDARIRYAIGDTTPVEYKTPTNPPTLKKPSSGFTQISLFDLPE